MLLGDARTAAPVDPATASVGWDARRGADVLATPAGARWTPGRCSSCFAATARRGRSSPSIASAADGKPLWRTSYEDHETVGGVRVPGTIRFAEANSSFDDGVEIKFKDRTLNAASPAGAYTLAPPAGATVVEVGCGPAPK